MEGKGTVSSEVLKSPPPEGKWVAKGGEYNRNTLYLCETVNKYFQLGKKKEKKKDTGPK